MNKSIPLLAIVFINLGLAGCIPADPAYLTTKLTRSEKMMLASHSRTLKQGVRCKVSVNIIDARDKNSTLGRVAGRQIKSENMISWMNNQFQILSNNKLSFITAKDNQDHDKTGLVFILRKAYAYSLSTTINANIVAGLKFRQMEKEKFIRGHYTASNWNSSDSEIQDAFHKAFVDLVEQSDEIFNEVCKNKNLVAKKFR